MVDGACGVACQTKSEPVAIGLANYPDLSACGLGNDRVPTFPKDQMPSLILLEVMPRVKFKGHIPALDGLRGMAILFVMVFHLASGYGTSQYPGMFGRVLFSLAKVGWCGVDLFFVLSGFLITGILYDAKGSHHYFRNFYMRRVLRIFPLYYGILVSCFILAPVFARHYMGESSGQVWLWFYASNIYPVLGYGKLIVPNAIGFEFGHFWSLAVEEHFYLIWPMIVFLFERKTLILVAAGLTVMAVCCRIALLDRPLLTYAFTPCRIDALAIGACIALLARNSSGQRLLSRMVLPILTLSAMVLLTMYWWCRLDPHASATASLGFTFVALFFGSLLVLILRSHSRSILNRVCANRLMSFFGRYSYGMYAFHFVAGSIVGGTPLAAHRIVTWTGRWTLSVILYNLACIVFTAGIAYVSWHLYEKHFLQLKRHFSYEIAAKPCCEENRSESRNGDQPLRDSEP